MMGLQWNIRRANFLLLVVLPIAACQSVPPERNPSPKAGRALMASYHCPLVRKKAGNEIMLDLFDDDKAIVKIRGVNIGGVADPELSYHYSDEGEAFNLVPDSADGKEMGPIIFRKSEMTLALVDRPMVLTCQN